MTTSDLWTDSEIKREEVSVQDLRQHLPNITEELLVQRSEEGLLFFWAHSSFFKIAYDKTRQSSPSGAENTEQNRPLIQDKMGHAVGFVCKPRAARGGDDRLREFVAIGQRQINVDIPETLAEEICPPVILALEIERDQDGMCSRVNYGEIGLKAWMQAEPKRVLHALL